MMQLNNCFYCGAVIVLLLFKIDNFHGYKIGENYFTEDYNNIVKRQVPTQSNVVFSVTNSSIELRWSHPYDLEEPPDRYFISWQSAEAYKSQVTVFNGTEYCEIWTEFICGQFFDLLPDTRYTFKIYKSGSYPTIDDDVLLYEIETKTKNMRPSKPQNLTYRWNTTTNALVLQWDHPYIPNGNITMFSIYKSKDHIADYPISEPQFTYTYEIEYDQLKVEPSCDDLEISVVARNGIGINETVLKIPMPISRFRSTAYIKDKTATTFEIQLPEITRIYENLYGLSIIYVIVSNAEKSHKHAKKYSDWAEMALQIAGINKSTVSEIAVADSYSLSDVKFSELLLPETKYKLIFLLRYQFKNMICYSVTTLEATTLPDRKYAILVFLMTPFLTCLLIVVGFKRKRRILLDAMGRFSNKVVREEEIVYEECIQPGHSQCSDTYDGYINPDLLATIMPLNSRSLQTHLEHQYMEVLAEQPTSQEQHYDKLQNHLRTPSSPKANPTYVKVILEEHANELVTSLKSKMKGTNTISEPIKLNEFEHYVRYCLEKGEFEKQYRQGKPEVPYKNRVGRSSLQLPNVEANYVDGYNASKTYIATVEPVSDGADCFWKMIWQENIRYIIMITDPSQTNEDEMKKYWFDINEPKRNIIVTSLKNTSFPYHRSTILNLTYQGAARQVQHLHFTAWPCDTLPFYPQALALFLKQIGTIPYGKQPIVIQSSKGFGRIATFIICDISLRAAAATSKVDVYSILCKLREQRINVDNVDQYKFAHLVLLYCLVNSENEIRCTMEMMKTVKDIILSPNKLLKQMKYIDDSSWQDKAIQSMFVKIQFVAEGEDNKAGPDDYTEVILKSYASCDNLSTYIDAVQVERFLTTSKFIVTKYPQQCTLAEFWRLIDKCKTEFMICLNESHLEDKTYYKFYPSFKESMSPVSYLKIHCTEVQKGIHYDMYTIRIINRMKNRTERTIKILHINQWKCAVLYPESPDILFMAYEEVNRLKGKTNPIFVTCVDGIRGGGLFTSLCYLIDKIRTEQICDVCLAVRTVRRNQAEFVKDMEQLGFLYKCALHYIQQTVM